MTFCNAAQILVLNLNYRGGKYLVSAGFQKVSDGVALLHYHFAAMPGTVPVAVRNLQGLILYQLHNEGGPDEISHHHVDSDQIAAEIPTKGLFDPCILRIQDFGLSIVLISTSITTLSYSAKRAEKMYHHCTGSQNVFQQYSGVG